MRRLKRGIEIGRIRLFWTTKNWRSKPHPYWFFRRWSDGITTLQSMRFELFIR